MAKPLLLLALALVVAASIAEHRGALAATAADDDGNNLAQQQEQELLRVLRSDPASLLTADCETANRMAAFVNREIGPLGPVLKAILAMPEKSAADVRAKEEASVAGLALLLNHFRQLEPYGSGKTTDHEL